MCKKSTISFGRRDSAEKIWVEIKVENDSVVRVGLLVTLGVHGVDGAHLIHEFKPLVPSRDGEIQRVRCSFSSVYFGLWY